MSGSERIFDFEKKVSQGLAECGVNLFADKSAPVGVAVSGGADSVSLLVSLVHICKNPGKIIAVTVNHNLRSEEESGGDAVFVEKLCSSLGVKCRRFDVPRGKILSEAKKNGSGVEDAARKIRYSCFEKFIQETGSSFLCLAHNRNDRIETVVMRFMQGAGTSSLAGIPQRRGVFVRPLIGIPREEIESYLCEQGISYRTDSTNSDTSLFRNCVRRKIMPFLDECSPGWRKAVLSLSSKMACDADFIEQSVSEACSNPSVSLLLSEGRASLLRAGYSALHKSIRIRLLYKCISYAGAVSRIPYSFVEDFDKSVYSDSGEKNVSACGISMVAEKDIICIQKNVKPATESVFFVIIEKNGTYALGDLVVEVSSEGKAVSLSCGNKTVSLGNTGFPFVIRSRQSGDEFLRPDGTYRSVSKIFDDWKCGILRDKIPLVQRVCGDCSQNIVLIWGELYGFKNCFSV